MKVIKIGNSQRKSQRNTANQPKRRSPNRAARMSKTEGKAQETVLSKSVPIQRTDLSTFDDSFSFLKEKFAAEMRRMDEEMTKFSADLLNIYNQGPTIATAQGTSNWEAIANSPLIQGEGNDKMLKLQFDLSQFDPAEIRVLINAETLTVQASHQEQSDNRTIARQFKREFKLPRGVDPNAVISSLSRDGVLTVQAPMPMLMEKSSAEQRAPKGQKGSTDLKAARTADETKNLKTVTDQVPPSPLSSVSPVSPNLQKESSATPTPQKESSKVTSKTHKK